MRTLYVIPFDEAHMYTTILEGDYEGRHFEISSYNGHPCAYVTFPEGEYVADTGLINRDAEMHDVHIHGGISYMKKEDDGTIRIGWDYSYLRDYDIRHPDKEDVDKYTLVDVFGEVIEVIEALNAAYR